MARLLFGLAFGLLTIITLLLAVYALAVGGALYSGCALFVCAGLLVYAAHMHLS